MAGRLSGDLVRDHLELHTRNYTAHFKNKKVLCNPMMLVQSNPFPAVLIRMKSALVALPWLVGPSDFYSAIREQFSKKPTEFMGDVLKWPRELIMLLDFYISPTKAE